MQVANNRVISIAYTLKDNDDNIIDQSSDGSFCYLHGASNIIPGLEDALTGRATGEAVSVSIPPEQGYGTRDDARIQAVPRDMFPAEHDIKPGMQFHTQSPDGQTLVVTVAKVEHDMVTVDGNHPLAGVQLNFDVTVMDIRDATAEELEHGHVHDPQGHAHD